MSTNGRTTLQELGWGLFPPRRSPEWKFDLVVWLIKLKCSDIRDNLLLSRASLLDLLLDTWQPQARASGLFELLLDLGGEDLLQSIYWRVSYPLFCSVLLQGETDFCVRYSQDYLISAANGVFPYMPVSPRR